MLSHSVNISISFALLICNETCFLDMLIILFFFVNISLKCFLLKKLCFWQVPVDLVVDHSVQVDVARSENAVQANMELEFQRNKERFAFLKWGSTAFRNMLVVPPGSGIVHQVMGV